MIRHGGLALFVVIMAQLGLQGCGYSTKSLLPEGVDRLAVDVFSNDTFYREIEFSLTRELSAEIRHRSRVRLTRRNTADAVLQGRILRVHRPTVVENPADFVSEQAVIVTAEVTLKDLTTGKALDRFTLSNRAEFVVERGESLQSAFAESLKDLAEDIVNRLQAQSFLVERGYTTPAPPLARPPR